MEGEDVEMKETPTSTPTSSQASLLSQRIVSVDFYSHPPNYLFDQVKNDFNNTELHWVPVIRIFGATKEGQKSCAHIHGVFPYLYIREATTNGMDEKELARRLDDALNRNSVATASTSGTTYKSKDYLKHIVQIVPVTGKSFYGYQSSDEVFLKIYFYTPFALTKASQLLANGAIMDLRMQPFESHIPYIQQFFIDYNLFGMNLIHYSKVLFRRNEAQKEFIRSFGPDQPRSHWSYDDMGEHLFQPESVKRMSTCELEFDVLADDILNRLEKRSRTSNPGIVAIWQDEMERRKQHGIVNWAEVPVPVSQDRAYCGDIFEAELAYRRTLLKKLEPFNYLSSKSNIDCMNESILPEHVPPASSQAHSQSSQLFLPQPESHVPFSAKERTLSQEYNSQDDEDIINFLEKLAHECRTEEPDHDEHSILNSQEFEIIDCTDDSEIVAESLSQSKLNGTPKPKPVTIIKVERREHEDEKSADAVEEKKDLVDPFGEMIEADDEIWSASFVSQTLDELEILEIPPVETISGSARTDPVCLTSRKTKEARNQWNNDVLEKFMVDIMYGKYEPIDLDALDGEGNNLDQEHDQEHGDADNVAGATSNSEDPSTKSNIPSKKPKLTLAQKLFPNAILRPEHFILKDSLNTSDLVEKENPHNPHPQPYTSTAGISIAPLPDSQTSINSALVLKGDSLSSSQDAYYTVDQVWAKFPPKSQQTPPSTTTSDKEIQVEPTKVPAQDFECQSYPVYSHTEVQTDKILAEGISTSTNTDPVTTAFAESQTDATSLDVVRTCGCRCNCGLQYMTALRVSWEMAEKNKERGVQTDEQYFHSLQQYAHSDGPSHSLSLTPKRLRLDDSCNDNSASAPRRPHPMHNQHDSSPGGSGLRRKLYKQSSSSPGDGHGHGRRHLSGAGSGISIQFSDLSPQQRSSGVGGSNNTSLNQGKAGIGSGSSSGSSRISSNKHSDSSLLGSPKSSKSRKPNWDPLRLSHPSKFSPQFDAVTKLLKRKVSASSSSTEKKGMNQHQNQNQSPSKQKQLLSSQNQGSPHHLPSIALPLLPISPRFLDMSITSVYEYEAPDSSEQKFLRFQAAKRGLRLFEYKHQQMLGMQRESAQRRKERRELRDSKIETKFAVHETIKPFKRTPQESFIASLVAQNERLALPPLSDYYAEWDDNLNGECSSEFTATKQLQNVEKKLPNVCRFQGGNLSDEDGNDDNDNDSQRDSQHSNSSQVQSRVSVKAIASVTTNKTDHNLNTNQVLPETPKTKQISSGSSTDYDFNSPRSILKSSSGTNSVKSKKRLTQPQLRRRSIRWGVLTPEKGQSQNQNQLQSQRNYDRDQDAASSQGSHSLYNADVSELDGPSPMNPYNACMDVSNLQTAKALHLHQCITTMCVEVFCFKSTNPESTSGAEVDVEFIQDYDLLRKEREKDDDSKVPDPLTDKIQAIFYTIHEDIPKPQEDGPILGMLAVDAGNCEEDVQGYIGNPFQNWPKLKCTYFMDEVSMLNHFLELIRRYDPDILVGYEVRYMSWGYVIDRGVALGLPMIQKLSRLVPKENRKKAGESINDMIEPNATEWNETINGRIVLNLWRLLRHEMTVQSYTFESAMFNIMHEKVGLMSVFNLNKFWEDYLDRHKTVDFYCRRVQGVLDIIDKLDLINRTSELARLFGIQFFEVFSRGSQFRVESMMLRLTKPDSLIPVSPTVGQRAGMRSPVELPLIMEPYSKYYKDPVAVLDFQSLYPSIIIAYNYDYSTCLGRVEHLGREDRFDFGCLDLSVSPVELSRYMSKNEIHISPTGVAFLKSSVRRGILPEMLEQILETRLMVKRSMKTWSSSENKTLHKVLDSRQLGLKLIANVTYGYTSANFSGRMPCVEIADSVVSKGRETLERAIKLVEENANRWGATVVYGDTDSMFIHFPSCSREKAFEFAQEIADEVTAMNPKPVKLKLEKIYQPCILQTKKRYVGFSYESAKQKEPKYDAKGIETVRRDGCPAIAKILEKSLKILFTTDDKEKLRQYLEAQFQKILLGNVNLSDFTFAREYRGWSGYKPGAVVPALTIAERLRNQDKRAEPQPKERVPYVVIFGEPGRPLIHQIRTPREFVEHEGLRINSVYYIERALLPPLNRCFSLAGIDVQRWYSEIPRRHLRLLPHENRLQQGRGIMDYFLVSMNCVGCDKKSETVLCASCRSDPNIFLKLTGEASGLAQKIHDVAQTCEYCTIGVCMSLDCKTWQKLLRYDRIQHSKLELLHRALGFFPHWQE